jgi:hypothetical protein
MTNPMGGKDEHLLTEYQCAQDSAQHHDNLAWSIIATLLGASLILLGFVLTNLRDSSGLKVILLILSLLGILTDICIYLWAEPIVKIKLFKYKRCKEIENVFGFKQHTELYLKSHNKRNAVKILLICFIITWIFVIIKVLVPSLP